MFVRNSVDKHEILGKGNMVEMVVALNLVRAVVGVIATPCALYLGYSWSNGRSTNATARTTPSEPEQRSTTRDLEAESCPATACLGVEPPEEAPVEVYVVSPASG